jgi:hypothetical protein
MNLPEERTRDLIGSPEFAGEVRRVRESLTTFWEEDADV